MTDDNITKEDFKKQRDEAIKQIVNLLNKYNLTLITEHNVIIIPKEQLN